MRTIVRLGPVVVLFVVALWAPVRAESLGAVTRLVMTPTGEVLVSDYRNQRVVVLDGATLQIRDEIPVSGRPLGVGWADGLVYVGNDSTGTIDVYRQVPAGKWILRRRFMSASGVAPKPTDIAIDESQGLLFVTSVPKQAVLVFDTAGNLLRTIEAPGALIIPTGIALDRNGGRIFVADLGDPNGGIFSGANVPASVQIFDYAGNHLGAISGSSGQTEFRFSRPQGMAVDATGRIYLADSFLGEVLVFDGATLVGQKIIGSKGSDPGQLLHPLDVAIDPVTLNVLVTSRMNGRVEIFEGGAAP